MRRKTFFRTFFASFFLRVCVISMHSLFISRMNCSGGPKRDILLLNTAAALVTTGKAADLKEGLAVTAKSIDSGAAAKKLEQLASTTQPEKT